MESIPKRGTEFLVLYGIIDTPPHSGSWFSYMDVLWTASRMLVFKIVCIETLLFTNKPYNKEIFKFSIIILEAAQMNDFLYENIIYLFL